MKPFRYRTLFLLMCIVTIPLTSCGSEQSASSQGGGYKETKDMVIDILKTDDGKKAIYDALSSPPSSESGGGGGGQGGGSGKGGGGSSGGGGGSGGGSSGGSGGSGGGGGSMGIKMILPSQTNQEVRTAVKDTLTSPEYKKEIEKIMTDPKFAGDFAKAITSQNKDLHMQLIKDPTYQKAVGEIMKSPEMMKMFLDLTKTPDYRKQSMTVMHEAMQNPLFRMEVMDLLKTVVKEELQPKTEKGGQGGGGGQGGQGGGGGKQSGGGGSSGGGG